MKSRDKGRFPHSPNSTRVRPDAISRPLRCIASRRARKRVPAALLVLAMLFGDTGLESARGAVTFAPFATGGVQYDSNLFMLPSFFPGFARRGITNLSDSVADYSAGFTSVVDFGAQRLSLDGTGTGFAYDRFSYLDHYEYNFGGELDWQLGPVVSGDVAYRQTRVMAPFMDTLSLDLFLDTERTAKATVSVLMSPKWRLSLTPEFHQLITPLPGFVDFKLQENIGTAALDYLGFGKLTAGVLFDYDRGRYSDIVAATRYNQRDADATASYHVDKLSTFSATAGYTIRDTQPNAVDAVLPAAAGAGVFAQYAGAIGTTAAVTGSLSYQRQLTGKTSASVSLLRAVESYLAGANPVIATGGEVKVTWKPDVKFTVDADYSLTRDQVQGGLVIANIIGEDERTQVADLSVRYAVLSWLSIRPYFTWSRATSTFSLGNYSQTIVGVEVSGKPQF